MTLSRFEGASEIADDARQLLEEIERETPAAAAVAGDCRPALDAYETATTLEVVVDLPGVAPGSVRVAVRRGTLLIVGAKMVAPSDGQGRFHLAERSHGRFARAVTLSAAFDATRARATMNHGELHVVLPKVEDRRGRLNVIPVTHA